MNASFPLRAMSAVLLVAGLEACASPPAPKAAAAAPAQTPAPARAPAPAGADPNGAPAQAERLAFKTDRADSLDRSQRDLDDWFLLDFPSAGSAKVIVTGARGAPLLHVSLAITDLSGQFPGNPVRSGGRPRVELAQQVAKGQRLVWIGTEPEATGRADYAVRAEFTPRPAPRPAAAPAPPPPPQVTVYTTRVVEFAQGQGETQFANVAGGANAGIRAGLRGRLKDGGRVIGQLQVVEVFPAGSRVRIDGALAAPVTARTVVEIDVPK
jgi:hypothetical protein